MNLPRYHPLEGRALNMVAKLESFLPKRTTQSNWFDLPSITRRQASPSSTCNANSNTSSGPCQKSFDGTNLSVPIAVGIVVPITLALVVLLILHRRHVRRLRREDATDRHKSLDFGMDPADAQLTGRKKKNAPPEMRDMEKGGQKSSRKGRGMSMDLPNPYLLPPELQQSRESLHSLSRTIHSGDDRYRPATTFISGDASPRIGSSLRDDSSTFTGSSSRRDQKQDGMNQNLLKNAQRMSQSMPPTQRSSLDSSISGTPQVRPPPATLALPRKGLPTNPRDTSRRAASPVDDERDSFTEQANADLRSSNNYLGAYIRSGEQAAKQEHQQTAFQTPASDKSPPQVLSQAQSSPPEITVTHEAPSLPRQQSLQNYNNQTSHDSYNDNRQSYDYTNEYEDIQYDDPSYDQAQDYDSTYQHGSHDYSHQSSELSTPYQTSGGLTPETNLTPYSTYEPEFSDRRLSILRPLPPDDPNDNPEQRANRIRSFYKEYFDDSKPAKAFAPAPEVYYEDYGEEFHGNGTVFDPASGQFVVAQAPYAEPITRRAMTPPPRGPPRFQGRDRAYSNQSLGPPRSRAYSSASGRYGPASRGPPPKALPPPSSLRTLPTPHLLKEDTYFLQGLDFAPPTSFRDRQAGRPESPTGSIRPYQPLVPAHIPLASAFNELPAIPSPYQLRKSGSFTALDFAPPPRFKNSDAGSDAGSIRSGRSNGSAMSASQIHSIRTGAYRVSRIPKEVVGTKKDLMDSLKPTWAQRPHDA